MKRGHNAKGGVNSEMEGTLMPRVKWDVQRFPRRGFSLLAAGAILLTASFAVSTAAQQSGQKTFSSPEEAARALYAAAQTDDTKALLDLLGPDGKEIVSSGDETEDNRNRANFAKRYQEMSRLVKEPDGSVCLYIGERNWPYPIPLVNKGNQWYFDTNAGKKEILYRRIGRNEISAIHICEQLVAAQKDFAKQNNNAYAEKIFSDEGKRDGLYWKASDNEPQSPIGPLIAWAVAQDNAQSHGGEPVPYRGYYFHVLTGQGKNAPGGVKSYIVDGKMTGGFAFVAYPAEYRSSGVMTFVVGEDGVVYEKDLGKKTDTAAKSMKEYNPGPGWEKAQEEPQQESASEQTPK
jgi:Protein of unknown function (DUF2950)